MDLSGYARFLDLGGGSGAFAIEAVKGYSGLSAVVFDLPQVVVVTEKIIQESGLEERITCAGGEALFLFGELTVSAQAQSYTVDELGAAMREAGFGDIR